MSFIFKLKTLIDQGEDINKLVTIDEDFKKEELIKKLT